MSHRRLRGFGPPTKRRGRANGYRIPGVGQVMALCSRGNRGRLVGALSFPRSCELARVDRRGTGAGLHHRTLRRHVIYTATDKGLFRSTDGGENWIEITSPSPKVVALAFTHSGTLYAINADGGLFRSADQGGTWNQLNA